MRKDAARSRRREVRDAPFRRVLVANRGEIALRIIRACHEAGIEAVAVHSDADAGAPFVRAADVAVRIGPPPAAESYLRGALIVDAAIATGSQAVHPGYGFLSEQAAFAASCEAAGLVFIGPAPETLVALGDKLAARRTADEAGVPIVPGTFEALESGSPAAMKGIVDKAEALGWPLLVKATAGGGGRGMRRVDDAGELPGAIASASREAQAAFGLSAVYLERLIEGARHVEVQLLGDHEGRIVAIGERDCSVQRRHQKLAEEAPAPGLSEGQRRNLHRLALTVARKVGLRNAATAEFLLAPNGDVHFLEVNARLQVEHGVTELVSGVDIVREQLTLAAGRPLSAEVRRAADRAPLPDSHAIEVRISAEDPARDFAPVPGVLSYWHEAGGPGVRVDSGVEEGMRVSAEYDPLLAKLLVVAGDRPKAMARMRRALDEFHIGGLQTTLPFHQWLLRQRDFIDGRLRTDLVARSWSPRPLWEDAARRAAERLIALAEERSPAAPALSTTGTVTEPERGWAMIARREGVERWP